MSKNNVVCRMTTANINTTVTSTPSDYINPIYRAAVIFRRRKVAGIDHNYCNIAAPRFILIGRFQVRNKM